MAGPTGVGKSSFAILLAEQINGEIIGADAFQIYTGLPLLTAQPSPQLQARIPHHLIGTLPLSQSCNAAQYANAARSLIDDVITRGRTPLIVGGTGLYIKAITHGLADLPQPGIPLRGKISSMSPSEALASLRKTDPEALEQIDIRNPARVKRALEIVLSTGKPLAAHRSTWMQIKSNFAGIVLERERAELRQRISSNVDSMFAAGVIEEVRQVIDISEGASRAIGFREIQRLLKGEITQSECRNLIIKATQRYAKRQLTWFRNQFNFQWLNLTASNSCDAINAALDMLGKEQA